MKIKSNIKPLTKKQQLDYIEELKLLEKTQHRNYMKNLEKMKKSLISGSL